MNEIRQSTCVTVEIFTAGDGKNYPRKGSWVLIHYNAYLSGGAMFDSSLRSTKAIAISYWRRASYTRAK